MNRLHQRGINGITGKKQNHVKRTVLLAAFLSFIASSSASCSDKTYVPTDNNTKANTKSVNIGKSFFPLGFYHVSWSSSPEQRMNDLRSIAAAGFNTIHASIKSNDDLNYDYGKFLDEADKLGVKVISEFGVDRITAVNKFKDKPAVLGWNIGDDAGSNGSANELSQISDQVKAADPNHLTYTSVAFDVNSSRLKQSYANYAQVADLIGGQSYPIGLPVPISRVNDVFSTARSEAKKYNHPVIANLQTFRWNNTSWSQLGTEGRRWPTAEEVHNMTYQALLSGVKGIIFYTYYDSENHVAEQPAVWNELKSLVPEIKKLSPILLNGTRKRIETTDPDVLAGIWNYQGHNYVMAISTSNNSTKTVSIPLPSGIVGKAQPMFTGRPSGMVVKDSMLSGSIKPLEVHIYSF